MCDFNKNSYFNNINHKNKTFNSFVTNKYPITIQYFHKNLKELIVKFQFKYDETQNIGRENFNFLTEKILKKVSKV